MGAQLRKTGPCRAWILTIRPRHGLPVARAGRPTPKIASRRGQYRRGELPRRFPRRGLHVDPRSTRDFEIDPAVRSPSSPPRTVPHAWQPATSRRMAFNCGLRFQQRAVSDGRPIHLFSSSFPECDGFPLALKLPNNRFMLFSDTWLRTGTNSTSASPGPFPVVAIWCSFSSVTMRSIS